MKKMRVKSVSVTVPAGEYWLGDPCYSFDAQEKWMELLGSCDFFNNPIGTVAIGEKTFQVLGFGTAHGDGVYRDTDGNEFGVDAGLIGLVPVELNPYPGLDLVHKVVFDKATECSSVDGLLSFGEFIIDTDPAERVIEYLDELDEDEDDDSTAAVDPWADEDEDDDA